MAKSKKDKDKKEEIPVEEVEEEVLAPEAPVGIVTGADKAREEGRAS